MARMRAMLGLTGPPPVGDDVLRATLGEAARRRGVAPWFDRFEGHAVRSGPVTLHLDVLAPHRGRPTIVFVPGTNAYALLYGELLVALADRGLNVVGVDPRGHGRSGGRRGSYTFDEVVEDLGAAISWTRSHVGEQPVFVAGSSQGGIAAFYRAARDTGRPREDAVAGAVCHNLADLTDPASACLTRAPRLSRYATPLVRWLARRCPELPVPMSAYLDLAKEPVAGFGTSRDVLLSDPWLVPFVRLKTLASLTTTPLARPVEEIRTPVLVLHADADTIFPTAYVRALVDRLPGSGRLHVYRDVGHYLVVDGVGLILDDIVAWIDHVLTSRDDRR